MPSLTLYFVTIGCLILAIASWITLNETHHENAKHRLRLFGDVTTEMVMSSIAYFALFFVLTLVIAGAIYILLLLLIYVPSDFVRNYIGSDIFTRALEYIMPIIRRGAQSPGVTGIPLLDYFSLLSFVLGPACGARCVIGKYRTLNAAREAA